MAIKRYDPRQSVIELTGEEDIIIGFSPYYALVTNCSGGTVYVSNEPNIQQRLDSEKVTKIPVGSTRIVDADVSRNRLFAVGSGTVKLKGLDSKKESSEEIGKAISDDVPEVCNNLLMNPDFRINQRGKSEYTGTSTSIYTVDRWYIWKNACDVYGTLSVNGDNSVSVDGADGVNDAILTQELEYGADLSGKTVTLSLKIEEINGTISVQQYENTSSCLNISEPGIHKVTFEWQTAASYKIVINNTNCTHYKIKWIKLEFGSNATQFVPPDQALELARCQRYLFRIPQWYRQRLCEYSTDFVRFVINTPDVMRKSPALLYPENFQIRDVQVDGNVITGFTFATDAYVGNELILKATKSAHGITDGVLVASAGAVLLSAE